MDKKVILQNSSISNILLIYENNIFHKNLEFHLQSPCTSQVVCDTYLWGTFFPSTVTDTVARQSIDLSSRVTLAFLSSYERLSTRSRRDSSNPFRRSLLWHEQESFSFAFHRHLFMPLRDCSLVRPSSMYLLALFLSLTFMTESSSSGRGSHIKIARVFFFSHDVSSLLDPRKNHRTRPVTFDNSV